MGTGKLAAGLLGILWLPPAQSGAGTSPCASAGPAVVPAWLVPGRGGRGLGSEGGARRSWGVLGQPRGCRALPLSTGWQGWGGNAGITESRLGTGPGVPGWR